MFRIFDRISECSSLNSDDDVQISINGDGSESAVTIANKIDFRKKITKHCFKNKVL